MRIQPVASPSAIQTPQTTNNSDSRQRAIQSFNQGASVSHNPQVQNQSAVTPEEMVAIRQTTTNETSEVVDPTSQESIAEASTAPESAAEDTKPPQQSPEEMALSRQFAQLARQEKALRAKVQAQEQSFKLKEAELRAKEAALQSKPETDLSGYISRDRLKNDPLSVLAEAEISYDSLTQQILNHQPVNPQVQAYINKMEARLEAMEKANEAQAKGQTEAQQAQYKAAINQITTDAKNLISTDPTFETVKATNSVRDVVELIERTFQEEGVIISVEDAAQQVEDYLVEEGYKLARLTKIQKRLQAASTPSATQTAAKTPPAQTKQSQPMKTLTNATSSTRKLSAKERAIARANGYTGDFST